MGEYHENLTLEEALRIYESIPAERINGIKGVGFELHDGSDYDGPYDLMRLGKVDREGVEMIPHYKESPLVQKAMDDVEKYFARKQELTKRTEQVVGDKPIQKENVSHPKSRNSLCISGGIITPRLKQRRPGRPLFRQDLQPVPETRASFRFISCPPCPG